MAVSPLQRAGKLEALHAFVADVQSARDKLEKRAADAAPMAHCIVLKKHQIEACSCALRVRYIDRTGPVPMRKATESNSARPPMEKCWATRTGTKLGHTSRCAL